MPSRDAGEVGGRPPAPSMLDLVRLSPRRLFPPGGMELYRQIALLTEMSAGDEVLDVACGKGVSLEYFVREFGVEGAGVEFDPTLVEQAEGRSRELGVADRLQVQVGSSDALPYRDGIFDIVVGEIGLASHCEPAEAVRELVRVAKPGGCVVLVQLVWKAPVDAARQMVLADHLGARPQMLVEWRRLLREAGVADVHTENWSHEETSFRSALAKPFPDFAELFTLQEKIGILRRVWRQWGWNGVRTVLARERTVHRLLTRERILGLDLLKGRKAGEVPVDGGEAVPEASGSTGDIDDAATPAVPTGPDPAMDDAETAGLPLFGSERDKSSGPKR